MKCFRENDILFCVEFKLPVPRRDILSPSTSRPRKQCGKYHFCFSRRRKNPFSEI